MPSTRSAAAILMAATLVTCLRVALDAPRAGRAEAQPADPTEVLVELSADHGTASRDVREPASAPLVLPVLFLHHEWEMTTARERTLTARVSGLSGDRSIVLQAISQRVDVAVGAPHMITHQATLPDRECTAQDPCVVRWEIDADTSPSDFYSLVIRDGTGRILWRNGGRDRPDFVMLDRWDVDLGEYTVRILYATLFPYALGQSDLGNRLPAGEVRHYIGSQFAPMVAETWHTQFAGWGLGRRLHEAWDADGIVEIVVTDPPFTLFGHLGTRSQFIGADGRPTPECRIWWSSANNSFQAYRTLEDATRAVFAHEFFHLVQRNILLYAKHPDRRWMNVFIEAQGKFAPSVQHPDLELRRYGVHARHQSEYLEAANRYLTQQLNASYRDLDADRVNRYDAALYWRFLYEQYGTMDVVSTALMEMTKLYDPDVVAGMRQAMDSTFAQLDGPFSSHTESLSAFARANYALLLRDGRCRELGTCSGSYYDPSGTYAMPPLAAELRYEGNRTSYEGEIPASFGMDFIEVEVGAREASDSLVVTVNGLSRGAEFSVQVWHLKSTYPRPSAVTGEPVELTAGSDGMHRYVPRRDDVALGSRLALIITRVDADESTDPIGAYSVRVGRQGESGVD